MLDNLGPTLQCFEQENFGFKAKLNGMLGWLEAFAYFGRCFVSLALN